MDSVNFTTIVLNLQFCLSVTRKVVASAIEISPWCANITVYDSGGKPPKFLSIFADV